MQQSKHRVVNQCSLSITMRVIKTTQWFLSDDLSDHIVSGAEADASVRGRRLTNSKKQTLQCNGSLDSGITLETELIWQQTALRPETTGVLQRFNITKNISVEAEEENRLQSKNIWVLSFLSDNSGCCKKCSLIIDHKNKPFLAALQPKRYWKQVKTMSVPLRKIQSTYYEYQVATT